MSTTFSTSDGPFVNNLPGPVVAGDFNRDGKLDLAILMEDTGQVWVFTGDGRGHFTHTDTTSVGSEPTGLTAVPGAAAGLFDLLAIGCGLLAGGCADPSGGGIRAGAVRRSSGQRVVSSHPSMNHC